MVSVGLLGGISLGIMQFVTHIEKSKVRADSVVEVSLFGNMLNRYFYSDKGCAEFVGNTYGATFSDISINTLNYFGISPITKNTKLRKITVAELRAKQKMTGLPNVVIGGNPYLKSMLEIEAHLLFGNSLSKYYYNIPVIINAAGVVMHCGDQKDVAEICASLLMGTYNSNTGQCVTGQSCLHKGTYKRLTCSPSNYGCSSAHGPNENNQYTNTTSCPSGTTQIQTSSETWTHTASCGKKCTQTITNNAVWYSCLACP